MWRLGAFLGLCCCCLPLLAQEQLQFYNWSDYLPEALLEQFTRETGIPVGYTTYDSNEAMYAKLKLLHGGGYDIVVPSTYYVDKLRKEGLLYPLDKLRLPNFQYLLPEHLNKSFDPANLYSVPYLWGSSGIAYDTTRVKGEGLVRWGQLWQPRFRNSLLLPNDMREVFQLALRSLGYSGNTVQREQIEQAYRNLTVLMPNVRVFSSDAPQIQFITGEVDAGMVWNGVVHQAQREGSPLRYVYPDDGVILWMDNLVIPRNAPHPEWAHRLLNFLLRPDIARQIAESIGYASPNAAAIALLSPELRNNPAIYPDPALIAKGEYQLDVGDAIGIYVEYWEKLKAGL